jgi:sugar phosphate isomerase/epimerase
MASARVCGLGRSSHAVEPVERYGEPAKFKFSLAAYSYRQLLMGEDASLTLYDFIRDCAKMQLEGTELTSYYFPQPVTPAYLRRLRQECFRLGLDVSGTAVGNDFGHPDPGKLKEQIENVKHWVHNAAILGAPVIRIFAGHQKEGQTAAQTHGRMVAAMEECCDYAGQHGVHLALENHGGPTATADGLLALVHDVKSPWFGVNLDTGNFHGENIYGDLARVAPYALNVQVKVVVSGPDGKKAPADFVRLAKILAESGYRGYVVLEYEESGNPRQECPRFLDQMRQAFA